MSLTKEQIQVAEVSLGMYVCELDRPWLGTPFLMQGFLVNSQKDLEILAQYCEYVFVDRYRSREDAIFPDRRRNSGDADNANSLKSTHRSPRSARQQERREKLVRLFGNRPWQHYEDRVSWRAEMAAARQAVEALTKEIADLFRSLEQGGSYRFARLKQAVAPVVSSIERNPDACMWLARMKNRDSYLYKHSVATAIWTVAFGRELGLPLQDLKTLGLGGLLLDVGKLRVDPQLLCKSEPLSKTESAALRLHVEHGLAALKDSPLSIGEVRDMIASHHERHDGSGYPRALAGDDIPLFARMAGIADSYDAMTSERPYGKAMSPSFAIKQLYQSRDRLFQGALVEEFIQAVGLYPAGTLVLLSSGEVGIVVAEGRTRRLKPQVLLVLDGNKRPYKRPRIVNLLHEVCIDGETPVEIIQSLEPGSYGVNSEALSLSA